MILEMDTPIRVRYTNWKGETDDRTIIPYQVWFGSTEYHPDSQWLVTAHDVKKGALRDFALKDMVPIVWKIKGL